MKTNKKKELCIDILVDIAAGILIAIGTYNFANNGEVSAERLQRHRVDFLSPVGTAIGTVALVLNIPVAIACYKTLGKGFMLRSIRSIPDYLDHYGLRCAVVPAVYGRKAPRHGMYGGAVGAWLCDDFYARVLDRWYRFYSADHQGKKAVLDDREYLLCDGICRGVDRHCADFEGY